MLRHIYRINILHWNAKGKKGGKRAKKAKKAIFQAFFAIFSLFTLFASTLAVAANPDFENVY
jgi:hypothetical protein